MLPQVLTVLVIFIEGFLHYSSRRELWSGKELPRPVAYVLGTLGMMVPFTIWLLDTGQRETALVLWSMLFAGGSIVSISYFVDWVCGLLAALHESRERESAALAELREVLHAQE